MFPSAKAQKRQTAGVDGGYYFVIEYLPGKMNKLLDALTRAPNVCLVGVLSGEDAVVKEQSAIGIINGVDASKSAEEQQRDGFCQAAWNICQKKKNSMAEQARTDNYVMIGAFCLEK